jgi:predicted enzyme related to lactoylglutathione lyase
MADKTLRGRFVWHELMTPDAAASHGFYSKALGWKTQAYEQDPSYSMFAAASGPLGGTVTSTGAPHWLPLIGTTDIEGVVRQATELGGTVAKDIGAAGGGRFAVLTDPQGATFGVYTNNDPPSKEKPAKRGEFSWHELATSDPQAAFTFYSALFGWDKIMEHDMGSEGKYLIFGRNGNQLGGIWTKPASMPGPPSWLGYVRVKDVNPIVSKVKKAGGRLINGPMEVPGGDWIAQFLDPQGAMFAVHALKADLQPAAPAEPAPVQTSFDSMAETTVLTDIPASEAKVRSAGKKGKSAAKPAAKPAGKKAAVKKASKKAAKKAAKKPGKKKAAKKSKVAAKKKKSAAKSAKKSAKKVARKASKGAKKKAGPKQKRAAGKKKSKKARKGK